MGVLSHKSGCFVGGDFVMWGFCRVGVLSYGGFVMQSAFPPYALLYAILLKAPLVLWGPQCPWFSGASGPGSRRFDGSTSGQGSVEPASGAVTTSRSVKACSSYLVSIQRFSAHAFSPGVWLNRRLGLGGLLVRDINLVGILRVACLRKYGV